MKLSFSLKKQEANFEADVEKILEKSLENNSKKQPKKSCYQIKQEETRKNEELKHQQEMQKKNNLKQRYGFLYLFSLFYYHLFISCWAGHKFIV